MDQARWKRIRPTNIPGSWCSGGLKSRRRGFEHLPTHCVKNARFPHVSTAWKVRADMVRSSIGLRTSPFQGGKTGSTPVRAAGNQNVAKPGYRAWSGTRRSAVQIRPF